MKKNELAVYHAALAAIVGQGGRVNVADVRRELASFELTGVSDYLIRKTLANMRQLGLIELHATHYRLAKRSRALHALIDTLAVMDRDIL